MSLIHHVGEKEKEKARLSMQNSNYRKSEWGIHSFL
jgi:hypothetical protein